MECRRHSFRNAAAAIVGLVMLGGCATTYDSRYLYGPRPVDVESDVPGEPAAEPVHTLVSIMGVRRADEAADLPASVEVRLRLENTGETSVTFDPASIALFAADTQRFADPIVRPSRPMDIAPQESVTVEAFFPFPDGEYPGGFDLDGLNVRWTVEIDGKPLTRSATFTRLPFRYHYPYHRYHFGIGNHPYWC